MWSLRVVLIVLAAGAVGCSAGETRPPAVDEVPVAGAASAGDEAAIRALLEGQVGAWNDGDLEGFMAGYEHGDELRFVSGSEVRYGWEAALDRYRENYPDRAAMGSLSFEDLDVRLLGPDWAMVFGAFRLVRAEDEPRGRFTLVLHKGEEGWRIVHDHTSS